MTYQVVAKDTAVISSHFLCHFTDVAFKSLQEINMKVVPLKIVPTFNIKNRNVFYLYTGDVIGPVDKAKPPRE